MRNLLHFATAVAILALPAMSQSRITDEIIVTLPSSANVGDHLLAPGEYKIRQIPSANNPRILQFIDRDGRTVQTSVAAIPTLNNSGADSTVVELKSKSGMRYVSRIWIEGKSYGYELPAPHGGGAQQTTTTSSNTQSSSNTGAVTKTGSYKPAPAPEVARAEPTPAPAPAPAPTPVPVETPKEQPAPVEAKPEPAPQREEPQPAPQPAPEPTPAPAQDRTPAMPKTADNTVALLLSNGALLLLVGMMCRGAANHKQSS